MQWCAGLRSELRSRQRQSNIPADNAGGTALVLSESMDRGLQTAPHVVLKVARTNTDIVQALSMDRYFSLFHVSVDEVAGSSEVDVALHAHGRGCKVRLYTDNYQAASEIAS